MTHPFEDTYVGKERRKNERDTNGGVCFKQSMRQMDDIVQDTNERLTEIEKIIERNSFTKLFLIELEKPDAE